MSQALRQPGIEPPEEREPAIRLVDHPSRRPMWRRWLVEAERGLSLGLRSNSSFFVHFFIICAVSVTGLVLGLQLRQWTTLVLALTVVLTAEMFNTVFRSILEGVGHHFHEHAVKGLRICRAAVFVALVGAAICVTLVFAERLTRMFGE